MSTDLLGSAIEDARELLISREEEARADRIVGYMWDEVEKIAESAAPSQDEAPTGKLEQSEEARHFGENVDDESPVQGIVGTETITREAKKIRAIPVLDPPPGYTYDPEAAAFVPDLEDPGWVSEPAAAVANEKKTMYAQGRTDADTERAQKEVERKVDAEAQQATDPGAQASPPPPPQIQQPGVSQSGLNSAMQPQAPR
tara:strand:- start:73 stop:672 length:600 start_codon:yes stop_codon:yes gene_type:complete